jgi:RNA 3'-terminal phosphate cyclase
VTRRLDATARALSDVHGLACSGSQNFRQRIVYATLSGKALRIDAIREDSDSPGLQDFEASFLRLVEKVTNGCSVEINETGALPAWTSPPSELPEV